MRRGVAINVSFSPTMISSGTSLNFALGSNWKPGAPGDSPAVGAFGPLTGGDDGLTSLDDNDFIGSPTGKTGLNAFDQVLERVRRLGYDTLEGRQARERGHEHGDHEHGAAAGGRAGGQRSLLLSGRALLTAVSGVAVAAGFAAEVIGRVQRTTGQNEAIGGRGDLGDLVSEVHGDIELVRRGFRRYAGRSLSGG